jgi:hypothetical protein
MKRLIAPLAAAVLATAAAGARANTLADYDLSLFDFDVVNYDVGTNPAGVGGDATASGTSGSLSWTITPTSLWSARTTTNGSFGFSALPVATDNLHPSGDYTITFSSPVKTLLVALSNDNLTDSINFGLTPVDFTGVTMNGTQVDLNGVSGGLVLFENVDSLTIHNVNNNGVDDGYDLAFWAITAVPEPGSTALWLAGIAIVAATWRGRQGVQARALA